MQQIISWSFLTFNELTAISDFGIYWQYLQTNYLLLQHKIIIMLRHLRDKIIIPSNFTRIFPNNFRRFLWNTFLKTHANSLVNNCRLLQKIVAKSWARSSVEKLYWTFGGWCFGGGLDNAPIILKVFFTTKPNCIMDYMVYSYFFPPPYLWNSNPLDTILQPLFYRYRTIWTVNKSSFKVPVCYSAFEFGHR